jgi:hypothetical protein
MAKLTITTKKNSAGEAYLFQCGRHSGGVQFISLGKISCDTTLDVVIQELKYFRREVAFAEKHARRK